MARRSTRGEPAAPVQLEVTSAAYGNWMCDTKFSLRCVIIGEDVHPVDGHRWQVRYCTDNEEEWLPDKFVTATKHAATAQVQVPSPPSGTASKKKKGQKRNAEALAATPKAKKATAPLKQKPEEPPDEPQKEQVEQQAEAEETEFEERKDEEIEERKIKVPFSMGAQGQVAVPVSVSWALSEDMTSDAGFQNKRQGNRRKAQYEALGGFTCPSLGFAIESPFYDILERGHRLVNHIEAQRCHYLNLLNDDGLTYCTEFLPFKGHIIPFANVRENNLMGVSQFIECPCKFAYNKEDGEANPDGSTVLYGFVWEAMAAERYNYYAVVKVDDAPMILRKQLSKVLDQGYVVRGLVGEERVSEWANLLLYKDEELAEEKADAIADLQSENWDLAQDVLALAEAAKIVKEKNKELKLAERNTNLHNDKLEREVRALKKTATQNTARTHEVTKLKLANRASAAEWAKEKKVYEKEEKRLNAEILTMERTIADLKSQVGGLVAQPSQPIIYPPQQQQMMHSPSQSPAHQHHTMYPQQQHMMQTMPMQMQMMQSPMQSPYQTQQSPYMPMQGTCYAVGPGMQSTTHY